MMHIAMHVKSTKILPTHNVIYSIVQWYLKEMHDLSEVPFGSSVRPEKIPIFSKMAKS